jgi:hypothetical protein
MTEQPPGKELFEAMRSTLGNTSVPAESQNEPDRLKALEEERGKVYGKPRHSHVNIGLSWTGLIQQHYGITLDHPLPDFLVAQMMVAFKNQRSARVFQQDNYDDAAVYGDFAKRFQQGKE